jgi:ATP-dependent DNA helicase 2 subunit 1
MSDYLSQCCKTTMLNKIVSSERDMVGVILFGTNKTSNALNVPHVAVLQDLEQPNADKIKQLETMLKCKLCHSFHTLKS